jgi:dTDP-4-dehydrorhamnose reductase
VRALVAGSLGQLGRELVAQLGSEVAWDGDRAELDVTDGAAVRALVARVRPDVVFNATAWNRVDAAETDPGAAFAVNAAAPHHLARAARAAGRPYLEEDAPRPLGVYGASKLSGEVLVAASGPEHLVVRTSGLLGRGGSEQKGGSFVDRIVARARAGEPLRVVADQFFAPTCAEDLARAAIALVRARARGLFHVANEGSCSWHELACAALAAAGVSARVEPIALAELALPAPRPRYSVLACARYRALGLPPLRHWRDALPECLGTSARA